MEGHISGVHPGSCLPAEIHFQTIGRLPGGEPSFNQSPRISLGFSKRCWTCADPSAIPETLAEAPAFRE
jgi:hypothetical protein